jgi:DNA mismatch repair ATPase MutL
MSEDELNQDSAGESEQSDEQPVSSEQSQESEATEQSPEQSVEGTDQSADQSDEKPADESGQPAEQSEEQGADSDQPAEQSEEQPADASANNSRSTHMADTRSYSAGLFLLSLDGEAAVLKGVDVGTIKGEVVIIKIGMSMGKGVYEWIKASLDETHLRKNGYVVATDYNYKAKSYHHFRDALITEITIPALDGSSKDTSFFTIKFAPEEITYQAGDDADIKGVVNTKQKKWLTSNFRLRLGDLPCGRVSKIDSFTIKQSTTQDHVGEQRISTKEPTKLEFPNLKVTFSASDMKPWATFFDDFVIKGNNGRDAELSGTIEFLDPSLNEVLGSVNLFQVGIISLAEDKGEANKDSIKRWTAEFYVERMMLNLAYV